MPHAFVVCPNCETETRQELLYSEMEEMEAFSPNAFWGKEPCVACKVELRKAQKAAFFEFLREYHPETHEQVVAGQQSYADAVFTLWGKLHEPEESGARQKKQEQLNISQNARDNAFQIGHVGRKSPKRKFTTPGGSTIEIG